MNSARPLSEIRFHPPEEILLQHAGGVLPLPRRVMVESHLAFCAGCRAAVAELARPGGRFLRALESQVTPPADLWARIAARVAREREAPHDPLEGTPLPAAARAELPATTQPLVWSELGDAPSRLTLLAADPAASLEVYLICNPPATTFPWHRHLGGEDLLILQGGLADDYGHYRAGDFQCYAAGTAHAPRIDPGATCWAITCVEGGVSFER